MLDEKPSHVPAVLVTASITGCVLHQLFFKRVEVDNRPVLTAAAFAGAYFVLVSILKLLGDQSPFWIYSTALLAYVIFLVSLSVNILVYRLFFHPLNRFPGPVGAKATKFWSLKRLIQSKLRWYQVVDELHAQYGDYVRTGPRELLIFDPAAISPIFGASSVTRKGPFYGSMEKSVHTSRDKDFHRRRRKIWDVAFKQSLADYGPRVEEFTNILLGRIRKNAGKPQVVNDLCIHYSYDVMSALAFGKPMGFVNGDSDETASRILQSMQEGMDAIGLLMHLPWLMLTLTTFSWAIGPMRQWNVWSAEQAENRKKMTNPRPDIFGHLYEHTEDTKEGRAILHSEARLIIGAGSDTTASALTELFIHLIIFPEWCDKLRSEVDEAFRTGTYACTRPLPILDALVNETLRLHPPVFWPSQRETPPEGMKIEDNFIPGNTVVAIPGYQLSRDPRNFVRPTEFLPERWLSQPELIINRNAFMPFLTGPYSCPGKSLAIMELRSVIARTLHEFDVAFAPETAKTFNADEYFANVKEHFVAGLPKVDIVFTKR